MKTQKIHKTQYPALLQQIQRLPETMDLAGTLPSDDNKFLCVIGSRKHSTYGKEVCATLVRGLQNYPIVIVSGLAIGIDSIAHDQALAVGLKTIAFPGSGLGDRVLYPSTSRKLAYEIVNKGGALLSPFDINQEGTLWTFPVRNSLMAAISHAVLIIEACEGSGTLITATAAGEFSRELLVVPGNIYSKHSESPHELIRDGATLIRNSEDILEALGLRKQTENAQQTLLNLNASAFTNEERTIIECLRGEYISSTDLIEKTGLTSSQFNIIVSELELRNIVKESNGRYRLT